MYTTVLGSVLFILASWMMIAYRVGRPGDRTVFAPLCGPNPNNLVMHLATLASFMALLALVGNMRTTLQLSILIPVASVVIVGFICIYYDFRYNLFARSDDVEFFTGEGKDNEVGRSTLERDRR